MASKASTSAGRNRRRTRAAVDHIPQVDTGGEDVPGTGEHHGLGVEAAKRRGDGRAQLEIESADLAVIHRDDGDVANL
jgi:hypothetical protein